MLSLPAKAYEVAARVQTYCYLKTYTPTGKKNTYTIIGEKMVLNVATCGK